MCPGSSLKAENCNKKMSLFCLPLLFTHSFIQNTVTLTKDRCLRHYGKDWMLRELYTISVSEVQWKMNIAFLWLREALCCKLVSKGD